jgi:hypothetical protein
MDSAWFAVLAVQRALRVGDERYWLGEVNGEVVFLSVP